MKNQRMKTSQSICFSMLAVLLMAFMMIGCFAVTTFAANGNVTVDLETDLNIGLTLDEDGLYSKEYDGSKVANITAKATNVEVLKAEFNSANVNEASYVTVTLKKDGEETTIQIPAKITAKELTWGTGSATATSPYMANTTVYQGLTVSNLPELFNGSTKVTENLIQGTPTVDVNAGAAGTYTAQVSVDLGDNYKVAPLTVTVTIEQVTITEIEWVGITGGEYVFTYGDERANAIVAIGKAGNNEYPLVVKYPTGYGSVQAGGHSIEAITPDATNIKLGSVDPFATVNFNPAVYVVSMPNATFAGTKDTHEQAVKYYLPVEGDMPADVRALIAYTANGNAFTGTDDYGIYEITAQLPSNANYKFVDADGNDVTSLTATLTITHKYIVVKTADGSYQMILTAENGITGSGSIVIPEEISRKAIKGLPVYKSYTLTVTDVEGTYSILIPIEDGLYNKRCEALTADDIYLYDSVTGTRVKLSEQGYTVTVKDGYYQIDGVTGTGARTFLIAPEYNTPFWLTPLGIILLVLMILALLVILFYIGLRLRRIRDEKNAAMVIDTEGEVPAVEPVEVEDKVDLDEHLDETLDQMEENLASEVAAEEEATDENPEGLEEAVAESLEDLADEAAEISLEEEPETATEELADAIAEELSETEAAENADAEADEDAVRDAVAEAMEENFNESADATDAVLLAEDGMSSEEFRKVVDAIVNDAMKATMEIPEDAEEEATEETAEEADENDDISAVVVDCIEMAFGKLINKGVEPKAVEGTTAETITEAVEQAGDANIPENWINELANTVKDAVAAELIARLLAEPAVEAVAMVETEDDDDNDNDDDDDNDGFSFGGFAGLNLHFIDVKAEPETYAEMLEQESRGEVRLVYRYRRSFESRMIQSQGNVQEYYSILKNALLSFKGVKNRISWNYEAFNRGRAHVAKINAKTKTLYLYLALDPEELKDTKYGIIDVSSKKKYATVPVLMKIKGERKFKYALELIEKLCGETMELPKLEVPEVDYTVPYQTTEELVETGAVKMLAASIPESYFAEQEAAAEAAAEETTNAEPEASDVTFVEPTTDPAVAAAAEEIAAPEATAEEDGPKEV